MHLKSSRNTGGGLGGHSPLSPRPPDPPLCKLKVIGKSVLYVSVRCRNFGAHKKVQPVPWEQLYASRVPLKKIASYITAEVSFIASRNVELHSFTVKGNVPQTMPHYFAH